MFLVQFCKSLHFNLINGTYRFWQSHINEPIEFAGCYDPRAAPLPWIFFTPTSRSLRPPFFGSKASALRTSGLVMGIVFGALLPSPDSASLFCLRWYHSRRGSVDLSLQQIIKTQSSQVTEIIIVHPTNRQYMFSLFSISTNPSQSHSVRTVY